MTTWKMFDIEDCDIDVDYFITFFQYSYDTWSDSWFTRFFKWKR